MKENREFDMLENADEKTVELLAEVPVLTKSEKERMLAMSKNKLNKMNRENNITMNNDEEQVSGVERYSRPKWRRFAAAAACMLLVGGIAGTVFAISKSGKSGNTSSHNVLASVPAEEYVTTAPESTSAANELEIPTELYNNAVMLIAAGSEVDELFCDPASVEVDENDSITRRSAGASVKYCRVTDSRFTSLDDVKKRVESCYADPILKNLYAQLYDSSNDTPYFIEEDGKLYYAQHPAAASTLGKLNKEAIDPVILPNPVSSADPDNNIIIKVGPDTDITIFAVKENGSWKIAQIVKGVPSGTSETAVDPAEIAAMLNELEAYRCQPIELDSAQAKQYHDMTYYKVKDPTGLDFDTLRSYVEARATDVALESYSTIFAGYRPVFTEIEGEIYSIAGNAGLPSFNLKNARLVSSDLAEGTAVIAADNDLPYHEFKETVTIIARNVDGTWKVSDWTSDGQSPEENTTAAEINYEEIARDLMNKLNEIDIVDASGVQTDESDKFDESYRDATVTYIRVKDARFQSIDDVKAFVENRVCGELLERYSRLYSGELPTFKEAEGEQEFHLYVLQGGRGAGIDFTGKVDIGETHEDTFEFTAEYDLFGETDTMHFVAELDNGTWKISSTSAEHAAPND